MDTLVKNLIEHHKSEKMQKPNCKTRDGRSFLAFYLKTKFKQIINYDKKSPRQLITEYRDDFLDDFTQRLIERPQDRILISLTGESASGKSTICNQVKKSIERLDLPVSVINADNYFNDISYLINKYGDFDKLRDSGFDVDSPDNFNLLQMREDLLNLQSGKDVYIPEYLVNGTGISKPNSIYTKANKVILVEGMCSIYEGIRDLFDIKIYIELNEIERKRRFFERAAIRNQDEENASKHWEYILNAGKKYVASNKDKCDVVINGECNFDYFSKMVEYIYLITNDFCEEE